MMPNRTGCANGFTLSACTLLKDSDSPKAPSNKNRRIVLFDIRFTFVCTFAAGLCTTGGSERVSRGMQGELLWTGN